VCVVIPVVVLDLSRSTHAVTTCGLASDYTEINGERVHVQCGAAQKWSLSMNHCRAY